MKRITLQTDRRTQFVNVTKKVMGSSVRVIVAGGRLQLGTWQGIFFCEFDGPREREVWVS
jgi:thiamine phosphate synthase YjbQ (UPF0047 family)